MGALEPVRKYNFALPYTVSAVYVHFGIDKLKGEGLFQQLPVGLQQRFQAASDAWAELVITEDDCDTITDGPWILIATQLGLDWSYE